MTAPLVRPATQADMPALNAIHNRAIVETAFSWAWEPMALAQRELWFADQQAADHPVLVGEADGVVAGFASYGPFRAYHGYRDTVEHSVYLDPRAHRRGLGRVLMSRLIDEARMRKMHVMVAAIALPNDASLALHRALGFEHAGVIPESGLKFGRYMDLCLMHKRL